MGVSETGLRFPIKMDGIHHFQTYRITIELVTWFDLPLNHIKSLWKSTIFLLVKSHSGSSLNWILHFETHTKIDPKHDPFIGCATIIFRHTQRLTCSPWSFLRFTEALRGVQSAAAFHGRMVPDGHGPMDPAPHLCGIWLVHHLQKEYFWQIS
jgi:hypothetical protein